MIFTGIIKKKPNVRLVRCDKPEARLPSDPSNGNANSSCAPNEANIKPLEPNQKQGNSSLEIKKPEAVAAMVNNSKAATTIVKKSETATTKVENANISEPATAKAMNVKESEATTAIVKSSKAATTKMKTSETATASVENAKISEPATAKVMNVKDSKTTTAIVKSSKAATTIVKKSETATTKVENANISEPATAMNVKESEATTAIVKSSETAPPKVKKVKTPKTAETKMKIPNKSKTVTKVKKATKSKSKALLLRKTKLRLKMKRDRPTRKFHLKLIMEYHKKFEIYKSRTTRFPLHKYVCDDCELSFAKRGILNFHKRQVFRNLGRESSCESRPRCQECGYVTTKVCAEGELRRHHFKAHSPCSTFSLATEKPGLLAGKRNSMAISMATNVPNASGNSERLAPSIPTPVFSHLRLTPEQDAALEYFFSKYSDQLS